MDEGPLVSQQIDAGLKFVDKFQKYVPVQVALWLKNEDGNWNFYLASDKITDENFDLGYDEVARITSECPDPWLDAFDIKLIGIDDPRAKAALRAHQQDAGRTYKRIRPRGFGGRPAEEVFLYPLLAERTT